MAVGQWQSAGRLWMQRYMEMGISGSSHGQRVMDKTTQGEKPTAEGQHAEIRALGERNEILAGGEEGENQRHLRRRLVNNSDFRDCLERFQLCCFFTLPYLTLPRTEKKY